jgi:hypothetical protein
MSEASKARQNEQQKLSRQLPVLQRRPAEQEAAQLALRLELPPLHCLLFRHERLALDPVRRHFDKHEPWPKLDLAQAIRRISPSEPPALRMGNDQLPLPVRRLLKVISRTGQRTHSQSDERDRL